MFLFVEKLNFVSRETISRFFKGGVVMGATSARVRKVCFGTHALGCRFGRLRRVFCVVKCLLSVAAIKR